MDIFNKGLKRQNAQLKTSVNTLNEKLNYLNFQVQGYMDAMTGEEKSFKYGFNNFSDYAAACKAVNDRYENKCPFGNDLTANIIDFRAAVTASSGPQYKPAERAIMRTKDEDGKSVGSEKAAAGDVTEEAEREMEFCRNFFEVNDLNHETPQELSREGEIEGRVAVELAWDENQKQVIVIHKPWLTYKYEEVRSKFNPKVVDKITWTDQGTEIKAGEVGGDLLVCRRFSGRLSVKYPMTKIMRTLTKIDAIDQAFRDWREIDRLYCAPIPIFECETEEEAERMNAELAKGVNFKIKKAWAIHGKFRLAGPDMAGIDSLESEIKRLACFISGTTGYPLQFLLPDMLSNRSTSENIMESALVHTASERAIWTGFYEELIKKAMLLWQKKMNKTPLDPNKISISISLMTQEQWNRLTSFWLPAFQGGLVSREAVLPQIPDFNVREELNRQEEKETADVARISTELDKTIKDVEGQGTIQQPGMEGEKVADTSLNGAQISSMVEVVSSASEGIIPVDAVLPILQAAFPNTAPELISRMATSVGSFSKIRIAEKQKTDAEEKAAAKERLKALGNQNNFDKSKGGKDDLE
jgi:hypothetical protein